MAIPSWPKSTRVMPFTILFEHGPLHPQFPVVGSNQSNQPKQTQLGCGSLKHGGAPLLLWQGLPNCIVDSAQKGKGFGQENPVRDLL
jgi:hypothetical protein